jgi:hypothetical protein
MAEMPANNQFFGTRRKREFRRISARFGPIWHPEGLQGAIEQGALAGLIRLGGRSVSDPPAPSAVGVLSAPAERQGVLRQLDEVGLI